MSETACQEVRKLREGALPFWRPLWQARTEERAFLDGDRFENDTGTYNRDRRYVQFRGQETSNVNRHNAAVATSAPRQVEALAVDRESDADDAEFAVSILEWELSHPQKGFDEVHEAVVQDACDCRAGCAMLDFDPDLGPYGEIYARWKNGNLVMWEPGYDDPHHLKCGWFQEARRMLISDIEAMGKLKGKARWKNTEGIVADGNLRTPESSASGSGYRVGDPEQDICGIPGYETDDKHAWVLFCWYKNVDEKYSQPDEQLIPESERYMACDSETCPYRSDTQGTLLDEGKLPEGSQLPDTMEPCPDCGSTMSRIDVRATTEELLAYPKGKKLVIMPLFQRTDDDEPFYEGDWPVPSARSFPVLWVTRYVRPGSPMGDSDTTRNWDQQIASDQLLTMMFERVMRHQNYYWIPQVGNYDRNNQRFEFRDDQYNVIFGDTSDPNRPAVPPTVIAGSSLDPFWGTAWTSVQNVLLSHQGVNDLGLTPENSKDIPVGTVQIISQQQDQPIAHFIRRKNRSLGKFYGVYWDYIRATYTANRLARLNIRGEQFVERLRGDDLPNFDFIVSETPTFSALDKDRAQAFQTLMQIAQNPATAPYLDAFARFNRYPPSVVREIKRIQSAQPPMPVAPPGGPGGEQPMGNEQGMLAQLLGAGASPDNAAQQAA